MEIYTAYKRPTRVEPPSEQEDRTERTGYRSARQQIQAIERAGQRLQAYRQAKYWGAGLEDPQGEATARHYGELDFTIATAKIDRAATVKADLEVKTKAKRDLEKQKILDKAKEEIKKEESKDTSK